MNSPFIEYIKGLKSFVFYSNNMEYRQVIRDTFQMNPYEIAPYSDLQSNQIESDIDEESKDEMQYDMKQMDSNLTEIYEITKHEPCFLNLYKQAASQMISEDPLIGQVVLCSYDYFNTYFSCVWFYLHGGKESLLQAIEYRRLVERIK